MKQLKFLLLSVLSGVMLALSFPEYNFYYLAFISVIPVIYVILSNDLKKSLIYGFIFGLSFWSVSLYWMFSFVNFNTGAIQAAVVAFLLWSYLSLFFVVWVILINALKKKGKPIVMSFFAAFLWVALELVRTYLSTGFAWNFVGYSQAQFKEFIQIADILGVSGISFLIVFINMLLYYWLKQIKDIKYLCIAVIVFGAVVGYGYNKISQFPTDYGDEIFVGIVQPNIDQYEKWDKKSSEDFLYSVNKDLKVFKGKRLSLVVYPETFLTQYYEKDKKTEKFIKNISSLGKINLIGSVVYEKDNVYNSVLAFKKDTKPFGRHDKNHLVVFGEYIPFRETLAKFFEVFNSMGDFSKGSRMDVFKHENISVGSTICSENFFPELSRELILNGAKILTNHTNDGWFLNTAAPYQHFVMNIFRAVENRKNVIVCANSGISAIINCCGNVVKQTTLNKKVFVAAYVYQNTVATIYDKVGYLFPYFSVFMTVFLLLLILI
ncbi:MAG: apolipoprotein N-acyltransferase [Elusimicrobia bacterium]|nr:apolipoprotein N-acyltransferase [Elusimicrobiota bacterium]